MGGKDEKTTKTNIENEIKGELKMRVKNVTENINKSVTNSTMKVSNEMVNDFKSSSTAKAVAENLLEDVTIIANNGAEIDISQDASAKLEMAAVVKILSSGEQKNDLASKVTEALKSQVENDSKLKAELAQAAKIQKKAKESKGFADMAGKMAETAQGMLKSLTGGSSKENTETNIRNKITTKLEQDIENVNINENEIITNISNEINNSFKNMTEDECLGSASSRNMARKLKLLADTGAKIKVMQVAKTDAIAKCVSEKKIGNKAFSGLSNDKSFAADNSTKNTTKMGAKVKQSAAQKHEKESRDAISDTINDVAKTGIKAAADVAKTGIDGVTGMIKGPLMLAAGGSAIAGIIGAIMYGMNSGGGSGEEEYEEEEYDEEYDEEEYEMEGGNVDKYMNNVLSNLSVRTNMTWIKEPIVKQSLLLIIIFVLVDLFLKKTMKKNKRN